MPFVLVAPQKHNEILTVNNNKKVIILTTIFLSFITTPPYKLTNTTYHYKLLTYGITITSSVNERPFFRKNVSSVSSRVQKIK